MRATANRGSWILICRATASGCHCFGSGKRERLPYNFFAFTEEKGRVFTFCTRTRAIARELMVARQSLAVISYLLIVNWTF